MGAPEPEGRGVSQFTDAELLRAMDATGGVARQAAAILGVADSTVARNFRRLQIAGEDPSLPGEEWRIVAHNAAYEVSNLGRVRRVKNGVSTWAGRVLSPGIGNHGYVRVQLIDFDRARQHSVHRLVAAAFLGAPPFPQSEVNHKNGIKTDNTPGNLEWVTTTRNARHAYLSGLRLAPPRHNRDGEIYPRVHVTPELVARIRELRARGLKYREIEAETGVGKAAVGFICRGQTWKDA
jgi:hypothetical protein